MKKGFASVLGENLLVLISVIMVVLLIMFVVAVLPQLLQSTNGSGGGTTQGASDVPEKYRASLDCSSCAESEFTYFGHSSGIMSFKFSGGEWSWECDSGSCNNELGKACSFAFTDRGDRILSSLDGQPSGGQFSMLMLGQYGNGLSSPGVCNDYLMGLYALKDALDSGNGYILLKSGGISGMFTRDNSNEMMQVKPKSCSCTIYNFRLPQYVDKREEYIPKFGDPAYLVYWNIFPASEDTWDFKPNWLVHAGVFAVSVIPFGRLGVTGISTVLAKLAPASKEAMASVLAKKLAGSYVGMTEGQVKDMFLNMGRSSLGDAIKQEGLESAFKKSMAEIAKENWMKLAPSYYQFGKGLVIKAGTLEAGVAIAALWDNLNSRNQPVGNAIALKKNLESFTPADVASGKHKMPDTQLLPDDWKGKPVILKSVPGISTAKYMPFHLVSPCYLDSFKVSKSMVTCNSYVSNSNDGNSYCFDFNDGTDSSLMTCGYWNNRTGKIIGDGVYENVSRLMENHDKNSKLFEFGNSLKNVKVFFPWLDSGVYLDLIPAYSAGPTEHAPLGNEYTAGLYYKDGGKPAAKLGDVNLICTFAAADIAASADTQGKIPLTESGTCEATIRSDNPAMKIPDTKIRLVSPEKGQNFLYSNTLSWVDGNKVISFIDNNGDGKWEEIEAAKETGGLFTALGFSEPEKADSVSMSSIGTDGKPGSMAMKRCKTEGIIVDISNFDAQRNKAVSGRNYCFMHESTFTKTLNIAKLPVGLLGGLGALVATKSPVASTLVWSFIIGSAAGYTAGDFIVEYKESWPGPTKV